MQCMGTSYEGCLLNGRMDDSEATYKFPRYFKSEYHGGFEDGMFHGDGQLKFPELGVIYTGKFEKGKAVEGYFEFTGGLRCDPENHWSYCDGDENRAFKCELENGLKPAGRSQLTNQHPPQPIPERMYDCGDGFYDPRKRTVIDYNHAFLRNTGFSQFLIGLGHVVCDNPASPKGIDDEKEHNWIVNHCRKAWDEPVGTKKIH